MNCYRRFIVLKFILIHARCHIGEQRHFISSIVVNSEEPSSQSKTQRIVDSRVQVDDENSYSFQAHQKRERSKGFAIACYCKPNQALFNSACRARESYRPIIMMIKDTIKHATNLNPKQQKTERNLLPILNEPPRERERIYHDDANIFIILQQKFISCTKQQQ